MTNITKISRKKIIEFIKNTNKSQDEFINILQKDKLGIIILNTTFDEEKEGFTVMASYLTNFPKIFNFANCSDKFYNEMYLDHRICNNIDEICSFIKLTKRIISANL